MRSSPTPDGCYQIPVLPSGIFWVHQHTMEGSGGALSIFCYVLAQRSAPLRPMELHSKHQQQRWRGRGRKTEHGIVNLPCPALPPLSPSHAHIPSSPLWLVGLPATDCSPSPLLPPLLFLLFPSPPSLSLSMQLISEWVQSDTSCWTAQPRLLSYRLSLYFLLYLRSRQSAERLHRSGIGLNGGQGKAANLGTTSITFTDGYWLHFASKVKQQIVARCFCCCRRWDDCAADQKQPCNSSGSRRLLGLMKVCLSASKKA